MNLTSPLLNQTDVPMQSGSQLDTNRLEDLYGEDTEYAASMFETFLEDVLPEFDKFIELIHQQRWEEVRQLAHKLKPTLGMVGLSDLETLLAQFEKLIVANVEVELIQHHWHLFQSGLLSQQSLVKAEWHRLTTKL